LEESSQWKSHPTDPEQIRFLELDRKHELVEDLRPGSYWTNLLGSSVKRYPYIRRARLPPDVRPILKIYVERFSGSLEEYLEAWNRAYGDKEWIDQVRCLLVVGGKASLNTSAPGDQKNEFFIRQNLEKFINWLYHIF